MKTTTLIAELIAKRVAWIGLAVVLVALGMAGVARADSPGNSAVTVVPIEGQDGGVRLRTQTVDVTLTEDDKGLWADTKVWLQLSNPSTQEIGITVTLPGPQLAGGDLPSNLQIKLGSSVLPIQPAAAPATGQGAQQGAQQVAQIVLPGRGEAALQMTYRQALPETNGVVTFAYPLAASGQWAEDPESLRVTVSFDAAPAAEQILARAPEPARASRQTIIWSWDAKPGSDIWLTFLAPSWWTKFTAARSAAAAPDAKPAQHVALSQMYQQLASLPPLPFQPDLDFYSRYYPAAIAELQAATAPQNASGDAISPDEVNAHGMLARLYHDQANRLGQNGGATYLDLAAAEAQAALGLGANDQGLRDLATQAYLQLAAEARGRGDVASADGYLARLAALEPASRASTAAEEQKKARLVMASQQLNQGNVDTARQILTETFGADAVDIPALRPPLAGQVLVQVETTVSGRLALGQGGGSRLAGQRRIRLTLADTRDATALKAMLDQTVQAWNPVTQATITSGNDWLAVEFPFEDDRQVGEIQIRLAKLLPTFPELALVRAVLSPESFALRAGGDELRTVWRYVESAGLVAASEAWKQQAEEIRAASVRLAAVSPATPEPSPTPTPAPADGQPAPTPATEPQAAPELGPELGSIQQALWGANAAVWDRLANRSYAQYSVKLGETGMAREWQVPTGTSRTLTAETSEWRPLSVLAVAAGVAALLILMAYGLWRWL